MHTQSAKSERAASPNIVIIMADELRNDVVLHAYDIQTPMPNIDSLRSDGITFENCFCQTPTCCPSRGSFATGKYPHQLQLWNHKCVLPPEEKTMGHYFRENGYDAVAFGKTHGMCPGFRSVTYDVNTAIARSNHGYDVTDEDCVGIFEGPEEEFCDFVVCRQFDEYLGALPAAQPFLAHVGIYSPHPPLYPPRRFAEMHDWREIELPPVWDQESQTKPQKQNVPRNRWEQLSQEGKKKVIATVLGMSTLVDECVGKIIDSLKSHGQWEHTILVFTSDHGDMMGAHGMLGKFFNHYEESLRVPMIMRLPGNMNAGSNYSQLMEMLDVYPTLCDLAAVKMPETPHELAGRSWVPLLNAQTADLRDFVFSQIEHACMVRTKEWKLVYHTDDRSELYHLTDDPDEGVNLFGSPEHHEVERDLLLKMVHVLGTCRRDGFNDGRNGFFG